MRCFARSDGQFRLWSVVVLSVFGLQAGKLKCHIEDQKFVSVPQIDLFQEQNTMGGSLSQMKFAPG